MRLRFVQKTTYSFKTFGGQAKGTCGKVGGKC